MVLITLIATIREWKDKVFNERIYVTTGGVAFEMLLRGKT